MEDPTFSESIRRLVRATGMTSYRLAAQAGISRHSADRFYAGESCSLRTLDRIAEVVGLEVSRPDFARLRKLYADELAQVRRQHQKLKPSAPDYHQKQFGFRVMTAALERLVERCGVEELAGAA